MPLRRMNAMTTSMASADSISERSWFHRLGSPGALVSSVVSSSGMSGSSISSGCRRAAGAGWRGAPTPGSAGTRGRIDGDELAEAIEQGAGDPQPDLDAVRRRRRRRAPTRSAGSGARRSGPAPRRRAGRVARDGSRSASSSSCAFRPSVMSDLVEPGRQLLHGEKLRARQDRCRGARGDGGSDHRIFTRSEINTLDGCHRRSS